MRRGYAENLTSCSLTRPNSCRGIFDHQALLWAACEDSGASKIVLRVRLTHRDTVTADRVSGRQNTGRGEPATHHLFRSRSDDRPSVWWDCLQQLDDSPGRRTRRFALLPRRRPVAQDGETLLPCSVQEGIPNSVRCATTMCSTEVKRVNKPVTCCPPAPALLISIRGPYEYTVHVEKQACNGDLHLSSEGSLG